MEDNNQDQQNLTRLRIRRAQNGVQIAKQEENRPSKAHAHKRPIQRRQRTPANQRDGNPHQIRVPVQRPALDQIRRRAPEPAQRAPQRDREHARVAVDEAGGAGQEPEIVLKAVGVLVGEPLRDRAG